MKRHLLTLLSMFIALGAFAQKKDFTYKFYGFVRGDIFYNSRASVAAVDGTFYLYPQDKVYDKNGKDINAGPNGSFYTFTTRVGLDLTGPKLGSAQTVAKIETDFGGFSPSTTMLRIRQAYVALNWTKSQLLIGQTWHPLFGAVFPDMLNLSTGAPYNPFNRSPMLRYQYQAGRFKLTGATIWQLQTPSSGPYGNSEDYIKNSCVPELFVGADFVSPDGWLVGAGAHLISLVPRKSYNWKDELYKASERMTTLSYEAHVRYTGSNFMVSAKSFLASALDHTCMLGGYAVSSLDQTTGAQEYAAFRHSTSWLNMTYGKKWKTGLFAGYTKNLGTGKELVSTDMFYGRGLNLDQLITVNPSFSYNIDYWSLGFEYSLSTAFYGTTDMSNGKVKDTHSVTNHRILGLLVYTF